MQYSAPTVKMYMNYRTWRRSARIKLEQAMALAGRRAAANAASVAAVATGARVDQKLGSMSRREQEQDVLEIAFRRSRFATMLLNSAQDAWIEQELPLFRGAAAGLTSSDTDAESSLLGTPREAAAPMSPTRPESRASRARVASGRTCVGGARAMP